MGVKNKVTMMMSILVLSVMMLIEGGRGDQSTQQIGQNLIAFRVFFDVVYNQSAATIFPPHLEPVRTYRLRNTSPVVQTTNLTYDYTRMEFWYWTSLSPLPGTVIIQPSFISAPVPSLDQVGNLIFGSRRTLPWGELNIQNSTRTETVPFTLIPMTETVVTLNDWHRSYFIPFNYTRHDIWADDSRHNYHSVDGMTIGGLIRPSLTWEVLPLSRRGRKLYPQAHLPS